MSIRTIQIILATAVLSSAAGCEATFTPTPVAVAYVDPLAPAPVVPYDIYSYPHVYYGDSWVYLYNDTWYYPSPRGWMVYQKEPRELGRIRTRIGGSQSYQTPGYTPGPPGYTPDYTAPPSAPPPGPVIQPPRETGRERTPR